MLPLELLPGVELELPGVPEAPGVLDDPGVLEELPLVPEEPAPLRVLLLP